MIFRSPYPDVDLPNTSLTPFVLRRAAHLRSKPALIDAESGRALTYAELGDAIERASRGLAQHGFRQGDVLALYAANSLEYVIALHAAMSLGGSVTTIGPLATAEEVASQIADAGATWLAAGSAQLDRLPARPARHAASGRCSCWTPKPTATPCRSRSVSSPALRTLPTRGRSTRGATWPCCHIPVAPPAWPKASS